MDFPLLKKHKVDFYFTHILNKKFKEYKEKYPSWNNENHFVNQEHDSGYQSDNLLDWDDEEYQNFINGTCLELISKMLSLDKSRITYYWNHFLEYSGGGKMDEHKHQHNEDYVFFLYLNTCETGSTNFYLNDFCSESRNRTKVSVKPTKNLALLFSSTLLHEGEFTSENKKIFVAGIKINLE